MLSKFLHQPRFPWFTALSILTPLPLWILVVAIVRDGLHAHPGIPDMSVNPLSAGTGAFLALMAGMFWGAASLVLNFIWGLLAYYRREYLGVRIAVAAVALPAAVFFGWESAIGPVVGEANTSRLLSEQSAAEHARVWQGISDMFVQPDGKVLLIGPGLVRLLPDGARDPSFRRDYSFAPGPGRRALDMEYFGWSDGGCAALAPDGDLLLAGRGTIRRVRPDGSDGPNLLQRPEELGCWGLAVQPDGKVLVGWDTGKMTPIVRLLPDGSADPGFHSAFQPNVGATFMEGGFSHRRIVVLPDGKILLTGLTEPVGGGCIQGLRRLNADGSPDGSFRFQEPCEEDSANPQNSPFLIAILPDGSILLYLRDSHSDNGWRYLHRDGTPFSVSPRGETLADDLVRGRPNSVVPMRDGGIVLDVQEWIKKVRPDGSVFPGFQATHTYWMARKILAQGDKILILDHDGRLSRLKADGTPDPSFQMPVMKVYSD